MEEAVPASLLEMTVGDKTKEIWIQRSEAPEGPSFKPVPFGDQLYEIAYDVDRRPLGFELKLDDFEVGFEPGTEQATKFVSKVRLTDQSEGIKDKPYTISMNEPLTHRGYTFYQMRVLADRRPAHRPAHGPVPVGLPGGDRPRPADQVRRLPARGAGHLRSVLHASRRLHRRRQAANASEQPQGRTADARGEMRRRRLSLGPGTKTLVADHRRPDDGNPRRAEATPQPWRYANETMRQACCWTRLLGLVTCRPSRRLAAETSRRSRSWATGRPTSSRQAGRDARGPGQAAGHRGPRGGQAVFGRETIKLHDADNEVVETWGPVGAFLDWMVRPEFWDDQPFILVDYLPLRQVILAELDPAAAQGDRRQARPRPPKIAPRSTKLAEEPSSPPRPSTAFAKAQQAPRGRSGSRRRAGRQAQRGAQVADPARARGGQDHRERA